MMVRPKRRAPAHKSFEGQTPQPNVSGTFPIPSPSDGWVTSENLQQAPLTAAERLDNFFPTAEGARLRGGSVKHATLPTTATRMISFTQGAFTAFFAGTETAVYEIETPSSPTISETPVMQGFQSGDWVTTQFANSAGVFMVAVNGSDNPWYYDGVSIQPLADEAAYDLAYDALTADFAVGQTVTGGTSSATAEIKAIQPTSATAGVLKVGAITGTFQDNEALTGGLSGSATSNIPSGTSLASSIALTGLDPSLLSYVWSHQNRLWFVRKGTMKAYYLPVKQIGGALVEFDLAPVFSEGGELLFGTVWSTDAGDVMDDKAVFVSSKGQVAIYSGTDPNSSSTWSLQGVYDLAPPIDKHAHYSYGGDVMLIQEDGILPLSEGITRGGQDAYRVAVTRLIETDWQRAIARRSSANPIAATLWDSRGMLVVSTPEKEGSLPVSYVCNTAYRTWCRYVGWDVQSSVIHNDKLYFCDKSGVVFQAEVGGDDDGTLYTGHYVPKYSDLGSAALKSLSQICFICRAPVKVTIGATGLKDYENKTLPIPTPTAENTSVSAWGAATWNSSAKWGAGGEKFGQRIWKSVGATGFAISCGVSISSQSPAMPQIEIISTIFRYEPGSPL